MLPSKPAWQALKGIYQSINVHTDNDVREIKLQIAEPLKPEPTLLEVKLQQKN